jgi:hypothetical protein
MTDPLEKTLGSILEKLFGVELCMVSLNIKHILLSKIPLLIPNFPDVWLPYADQAFGALSW